MVGCEWWWAMCGCGCAKRERGREIEINIKIKWLWWCCYQFLVVVVGGYYGCGSGRDRTNAVMKSIRE